MSSVRLRKLRELMQDLVIPVPDDVENRDTWINGYVKGIQDERRRIKRRLKEVVW